MRLAEKDANKCVGCQCCMFVRGVYTPEMVERCLALTAPAMKKASFADWGLAGLRKKYAFKTAAGFNFSDLRIPGRILETPAPAQGLNEESLRAVVGQVQKLILE